MVAVRCDAAAWGMAPRDLGLPKCGEGGRDGYDGNADEEKGDEMVMLCDDGRQRGRNRIVANTLQRIDVLPAFHLPTITASPSYTVLTMSHTPQEQKSHCPIV
jgi:hypothetical protein